MKQIISGVCLSAPESIQLKNWEVTLFTLWALDPTGPRASSLPGSLGRPLLPSLPFNSCTNTWEDFFSWISRLWSYHVERV